MLEESKIEKTEAKDEIGTALGVYFDLMTHHGSSWVYRKALDLGVIEALNAGGGTAQDLAEKLGFQVRPTRVFLETLTAMDLVEKVGDRYQPGFALFFLSGSYRNLGQDYWDHLEAYLRTAQPIARMDRPEASEAEYQTKVASLDWMMKASAQVAARRLLESCGQREVRVLDLGAGSGVWAFQFLLQQANSSAVIVDWPAVLEVARMNAEDLGLAGRVREIAGNYHEVELESESFDFVFLGNITHLETESGLADILRRAGEALKPGGELVVFDVFPAQKQGKTAAALYELGLSLRTEQGRCYTVAELSGAMASTGELDAAQFEVIPAAPFTMGMVRAKKRACSQ